MDTISDNTAGQKPRDIWCDDAESVALLRADNARLRAALEEIAKYGDQKEGMCLVLNVSSALQMRMLAQKALSDEQRIEKT